MLTDRSPHSARVVVLLLLVVSAHFVAVSSTADAADKIVDTTMLPHDDSPKGVFRWSEGSILNLDGKQELMLLVTAFGHGGHDNSAADILQFNSSDGGRTWTPLEKAQVFQQNIGKQNVMAPSLLRLDNGEIICFINVTNSIEDSGPWMRRSKDNGVTWSQPVRLPYTAYGGMPNDRAIQLRSGRIVLPCWQSLDKLGSCYAYCFYSDDRGETWKKTELIGTPKGSTGRPTDPAAEEPAVIELKDGRLLMFIRTYLKTIYRSYSLDGGATWSPAESSGIPSPGSQVTLARLPTGDILLIYNWAKPETINGPWPRNFITAAISKDEGQTFSHIRHLDGSADFPGKITMANVEIVGNDVVVMYSKSESIKNTYDWRLQVLPVDWFYEGDTKQVVGTKVASENSQTTTERSSSAVADSKPRLVGRTHQLFLDDSLIETIAGLQRVVNQPVKCAGNPVLTYTEPWEGNCVITWGSVLFDDAEQKFKIWYESYKKFPENGEPNTLLCYATSADGVDWTKPQLNVVSFRGSKANNIVFPPDSEFIDAPTVILNPSPSGDDKYLLYYYSDRHKGICLATSPNGVEWTRRDGVLVPSGDRCTAGYDAARNRFYVITRIPGKNVRSCGLWESADGRKFDFVREIAAADDRDVPQTELYGMIAFPYAEMKIGFLEMYYVPQRKLDTQLVYSQDGLQWRRAADRQVFLPLGPPGSWDQAWVTPSHNPPIQRAGELYIYYQGRQTLHWAEAPFGHIGSVGLAKLRVDGFVSLDAQNEEGTVTTSPLLLSGDELHINALARPGSVVAEVLDTKGVPYVGYSRADCIPLTNLDCLDHKLIWKEGRRLSDLAEQPVKLRFYVRGSKLFSFWTE